MKRTRKIRCSLYNKTATGFGPYRPLREKKTSSPILHKYQFNIVIPKKTHWYRIYVDTEYT